MKEMKRVIYTLFIAVLFCGCTADLEEQSVATDNSSHSDKIINSSQESTRGTILVRFNASAESRLAECATRSGATRTGISGVDAILDNINGIAVEPVFVVTEKNRDRVHEAGLHLWYELRFNEDSDLDAVAADLAKVAEVDRIQFSHNLYGIVRPKRGVKQNISLSQNSNFIDAPFNDPYYFYQWGLENKGDGYAVSAWNEIKNLPKPISGSDINAVPAWKLCKGDPSIIVAVLDEGVMYSHEDLRDNMWVNSAEITGRANTDDDGNGYVDDIYGYNFTEDSANITWNESQEINGKIESDSGHGTHVAGIVSAVNNNGLGVSSIAGGSGNRDGVKVLCAQIMTAGSSASNRRVAKAMQYAADCGAHIMQCSWGYLSKVILNDQSYRYEVTVEAEAIDYFIKYGGSADGPIKGGLAIFAAGNDSEDLPGYPAAYEPCVAVASLGPALRPPYYTNYGAGTDIMAPGGDPFYINGSIISTVPPEFGTSINRYYEMMDGTSMACPMVSGVAALGLSYAKQLGKQYTAEEFRSMLLSATNDIEPTLTGTVEYNDYYGPQTLHYPKFSGKLGAGYIDAYKLLLQIDGTPYTTVKVGEECEIDLAPYFGDGVHSAQFSALEISEEDKENIALEDNHSFSAGKLSVKCNKCGVATLSVTLLVGGGSLNDGRYPYPTEVTKKFVVMVRSNIANNGGWL